VTVAANSAPPRRSGRSGARRGTFGELGGGDGGRRNRGTVTRTPKLSDPPWTGAWRRGRHRPADGVRACLILPGVIGISPGWQAATGLLAGLGAGCPATAARVAPCPAFQLRSGGLGCAAPGGLALSGARPCAGQSTR